MLPARRSLAASLGRFGVVLAILIAPWPGLGRAFVDSVGMAATALADAVSVTSNVSFTLRSARPSERQPEWRGVIDVKQDLPDGPVRHAGIIDLRRVGYLQLATFLSLAAAWPPRTVRCLLGSVSLAVGIVAAVIAVPVFDFLSDAGVIPLGAWVGGALSLARRALVAPPGMAYAIPGLAWLAMTQATHPSMGRDRRLKAP